MVNVSPDRVVGRARECFAAGDAYGTIHLLKEVIAAGQGFADAHHLLGLAYSLVGQKEEALAEFDRALARNPRYVDAHLNRAVTLNELGRYEEAARAFAAAQQLVAVDHTGFAAPAAARLANLHAELAEAYREAGGLEQGIAQLEAAVALRPGFLDLRYRLARLRLERGDADHGRRELEEIVAARPTFFDARLALGLACYLLTDVAGARAVWEACREQQPKDPRVAAYLALLARTAKEDARPPR